jgi:prepilin-type N-terminal cleavage/methylation domain-containing protein
MRKEKGFTLIELMIVVGIIALIAAMAIPNFITYRNKSRVATAVGTISTVRHAIAGYAADQRDTSFPQTSLITDWTQMTTLLNRHGATLATDEADQGLRFVSYRTSTDTDGSVTDYTLTLQVRGVPTDMVGHTLVMGPAGVYRQTE